MNISYADSQTLDANDFADLNQFKSHLESRTSTGNLFFEDLDIALRNLSVKRHLTTQKLTLIRRYIWEGMQSGELQLNWQPYRKP